MKSETDFLGTRLSPLEGILINACFSSATLFNTYIHFATHLFISAKFHHWQLHMFQNSSPSVHTERL